MGAAASVTGHSDDLLIEDLSHNSQAGALPSGGAGIHCFCRTTDSFVGTPAEAAAGRRA
ncbi:hypothetical protein ACIQBJ_27140 [Kitasatospora sp. NPDC088391]|uniref:hypothetical protein n=1 Tax=Kitasatospora sp. NPDC088391 TaxID=3364074 RepID=UPI0038055C1F